MRKITFTAVALLALTVAAGAFAQTTKPAGSDGNNSFSPAASGGSNAFRPASTEGGSNAVRPASTTVAPKISQ